MPEEPKRPLKVFLCHAHSDKSTVRDLYLHLLKDGVDAWLDKEKLLPGQDWELEIRKAVRESDVVVVCLSKQFNQAGFRQKEVRLALDTAMEKPEGEIFIIPARLEECDTLESLRKWHWVDLFEGNGYEMLMRALRARADKIGVTLRIKKSRVPKKSNQEKRVFYDLTAHYEYDFKNTTPEFLANFLFETLTRIMRTVTGVDKSDNSRMAEYQTSQVEYLDPKNGKTNQHALIVHGKKVGHIGKGDIQEVEPLVVVSEMLIITVTQGASSSRLRFDSNELPNDAFKNLVEWILADLGKSVTVRLKDDTPEKISLPKPERSEVKMPEQQTDFVAGVPFARGDVSGSVNATVNDNVINLGKPETASPEKPKDGGSKNKIKRRKPNTAITVALIGFLGTIIAGLSNSPWIANLMLSEVTSTMVFTPSKQPTSTKTTVSTATKTQTPISTPTLTPTSIPPSSILLQEDFEDNEANEWFAWLNDYPWSGNKKPVGWTIEQEPDGNYYWSATGSANTRAWYGDKTLDWTDYAFEVRMMWVQEGGDLAFDVRADAGGASYTVILQYAGGIAFFQHDSDFENTVLDRQPSDALVTNRWYVIRIEIKQNFIHVYIDNVFISAVELPTPILNKQGGIGYLMELGNKFYFDDIRVWSLKEIPTPTPTSVPTFTPVPPPQILLREDFEDGIANQWRPFEGDWIVEKDSDGNHYLSGSGSADPNNLQIWYSDKTLDWADYVFESRIKFAEGHHVGIWVRADGNAAFYEFAVSPSGSVFFAQGNSHQLLDWEPIGISVSKTFAQNQWYTIRVEIKGALISAYIDNVLALAQNLPIPLINEKGGIGYTISGGEVVYFDDVKVWSLK